ncbi:DUF2066 domain-containing protein [Elongatibacter sediminis]|uniref:DUF2066 domain-containing protein n=1 Tax=Elongatibacter sediminis TaxID=3119006 RepID=A0AAW9RIP7_9GAMM
MKSFIVFALALLLPVVPAHAAVDPYAGAAAVPDQSDSTRQEAMPLALAQVLQKLSGLGTFDDRPEVALALDQASAMAVSFYYRNQPELLPDGSDREALELVVHFAPNAVDNLVRSLHLPLWNPKRSTLTIWLLVDDSQGRRIMPIELEYAWQRMQRVAAARGLPVERPLPGPDGQYPVDLQLLWGGFTEELAVEGPVDALVIAALREGPEWNLRLNLDYGGERWSWREQGLDLLQLLTGVMHRTVDEIAGSSMIAAADRGRWRQSITIQGITGSKDYVRLLSHLQGISLVENIEVVAAVPGSLELEVELNALPEYFVRALKRDELLQPGLSDGVYRLITDPPPADPSLRAGDASAPEESADGPDQVGGDP